MPQTPISTKGTLAEFYVLEGGRVQVPGEALQVIATGTTGFNVREVPHAGFQNVGDTSVKFLTVHVVDGGRSVYPSAP